MIVPKLRSPIVLVHGLLGYDQLSICGWTITCYFSGVPEFLRQAGNRVLIPRVSPTAGVVERATQLRDFLDREAPHEPVHIFGHSMGGLDARYLISRLGMAQRVLSLTTLATPHRGTSFADWGIRRLERFLKPIFGFFDWPGQAFYDLTTQRCRLFNEQVPDAPGVRYFAVAGRHDGGDWWNPQWRVSHHIVMRAEGPNDGVVSVTSASYGENTEIWEGDHLSLANYPDPVAQVRGVWRDRSADYGRLVRRLADEGF